MVPAATGCAAPRMATARTTARRGRTQQTARSAAPSRTYWVPAPLCSIKEHHPARRIHRFFKSRKPRSCDAGSRATCRHLRRRKKNDAGLCHEIQNASCRHFRQTSVHHRHRTRRGGDRSGWAQETDREAGH